MKKKVVKVFSFLVVVAVVISFNWSLIAASSGESNVNVPLNCEFVLGSMNVTRSTAYSYVEVQAYAVTPRYGGTDNYRYCRTILKGAGSNGVISRGSYYTLDEENTICTQVKIREGQLFWSQVDIYFAGNNESKEANVRYYYNGK
ncbi:MAG: hypothetical protein K6F17_07840 [Lachnospiraceae bacterium]|nr:hypothetical protein [Lachnospiraceae bacterium]